MRVWNKMKKFPHRSGTGKKSPTDKFIISHSRLENMHDIVTSKKMENGIVVFWSEKGEKKYESFNFSELVDMKINALDLLERPKSYKVDTAAHKIIVQK